MINKVDKSTMFEILSELYNKSFFMKKIKNKAKF